MLPSRYPRQYWPKRRHLRPHSRQRRECQTMSKKTLLILGGLLLSVGLVILAVSTTRPKPSTSTPTASTSPSDDSQKSVTTLIAVLPYKNDDYKIDYIANDDGSVDFFVTPFTKYGDGNPDERDAELRTHKKAALEYIAKYGGDINKLGIIVEPDPDNAD